MFEIILEYFNLEVVGKPTYEYFAKLGIYFFSLGYQEHILHGLV